MHMDFNKLSKNATNNANIKKRKKSCTSKTFKRHIDHFLIPSSPSAQAQKSPAVRVKDSTAPLQVRDSTAASIEDFPCKDHTVHSYQQISCLDSVIR